MVLCLLGGETASYSWRHIRRSTVLFVLIMGQRLCRSSGTIRISNATSMLGQCRRRWTASCLLGCDLLNELRDEGFTLYLRNSTSFLLPLIIIGLS